MPPTGTFTLEVGPSSTIVEKDEAEFRWSALDDQGVSIPVADLTFDWQFGDGDSSTATTLPVKHKYMTAGTPTAALTITWLGGTLAPSRIAIDMTVEPLVEIALADKKWIVVQTPDYDATESGSQNVFLRMGATSANQIEDVEFVENRLGITIAEKDRKLFFHEETDSSGKKVHKPHDGHYRFEDGSSTEITNGDVVRVVNGDHTRILKGDRIDYLCDKNGAVSQVVVATKDKDSKISSKSGTTLTFGYKSDIFNGMKFLAGVSFTTSLGLAGSFKAALSHSTAFTFAQSVKVDYSNSFQLSCADSIKYSKNFRSTTKGSYKWKVTEADSDALVKLVEKIGPNTRAWISGIASVGGLVALTVGGALTISGAAAGKAKPDNAKVETTNTKKQIDAAHTMSEVANTTALVCWGVTQVAAALSLLAHKIVALSEKIRLDQTVKAEILMDKDAITLRVGKSAVIIKESGIQLRGDRVDFFGGTLDVVPVPTLFYGAIDKTQMWMKGDVSADGCASFKGTAEAQAYQNSDGTHKTMMGPFLKPMKMLPKTHAP